jgi:hypothetical protein
MSDEAPGLHVRQTRKRTGEAQIDDFTMFVRVPGQPAAVRLYTDDEQSAAARLPLTRTRLARRLIGESAGFGQHTDGIVEHLVIWPWCIGPGVKLTGVEQCCREDLAIRPTDNTCRSN